MQKLDLHLGAELQGKFELKKLNLLFVFQVNCPGCLLYGIPVINKLYNERNSEMSFLGMSTAFEDFDLNTEENTRLLLETGLLVGETKKALAEHEMDKYEDSIDFPIVIDKHADDSFDFMKTAEQMCSLNEGYDDLDDLERKGLKKNVLGYLQNLNHISLTFTLNHLRGTPSVIIFDDKYEILDQWFGHKYYEELTAILNFHLSTQTNTES